MAVGFVKVVSQNKLLVTDNFLKETTKNLKTNPNVALAVWARNWENDKECDGYEFKGKAEYFQQGKWYNNIKQIPENNGYPRKGAILVSVNQIKNLVS